MAKKEERSLQFKKCYLKMREDGKTPYEISAHFGLSHVHGYRLIHELADELGTNYEDLIIKPHKKHELRGGRKELKSVKPIDVSEFQKQYREAFSYMDKTNNAMKTMLRDWPEVNVLEDSEQEEKQ